MCCMTLQYRVVTNYRFFLRYTFSTHELWNRRIVDVSTGFNTLSIGFGIVSGLFLILKVFIKAIFLLGDNIVAHTLWYSFVQRNLFYLSLKLMAVLYNLYLNSFNLFNLTISQWKCFLFARRPTCANSQVFRTSPVFLLDNGRITHSLSQLFLKRLLLVGRFIHFFVLVTRDLGIEDSLAP
jgi:hypothetical protein